MIYVGAGAAAFIILILFIVCIVCIRAKKNRNRSQHTTDESKQHPGKECGVDNMYASINKPVYQEINTGYAQPYTKSSNDDTFEYAYAK